MYSTIRIETDNGFGTGFFFQYCYEDKFIPVILTNWHVVENSKTGKFLLHSAMKHDNSIPGQEVFKINMDKFESRWIRHPDPSVDLCAFPVNFIIEGSKKIGKFPFVIFLTENEIPSQLDLQEMDAVEDILMAGYPIGLSDTFNNLPLLRKGITASHPAVDFDNDSIGVIDSACFPGSSGSPIILYNVNKQDKTGKLIFGEMKFFLLGLLSQSHSMEVNGIINITPISLNVKPIPVIEVMTNLGFYVKSKEIMKLKEIIKNTLI